jgi:two-component system LytT family response regulator
VNLRVLIVDDEPLARERIRTLLHGEKDLVIVGECGDGLAAVEALRTLSPDLMFLDVQMPGMDGFEVLRQAGTTPLPAVIFVTAYDQHALRAFEVHAIDYLLKPFKPARFKDALQQARESLAGRRAETASRRLLELLGKETPAHERITRFPVKTGDRTVFIKASDVDYFESAGNYVVLHSGKENHVIRETLSALEEKLDARRFARINRSMLVNIEQIRELQPLFKGEHVVVLRNGKQLALTRGVRELEDLLRFS